MMHPENNDAGPFLPPGTKVRLDGHEDGPEVGIVVHCWYNDELDIYDCYVAFFGTEYPVSEPKGKPYVLRYAALSLDVLE